MKEKDLEKMLDSIIVDGLIKEAEQDNADLFHAMKKISDEDFDEIVRVPEYAEERVCAAMGAEPAMCAEPAEYSPAAASVPVPEPQQETPVIVKSKKRFSIKPWIYSISAAAAILACVLVPAYNSMNNKLCDGALLASNQYIVPARGGFDVGSATTEEIKTELPNLEKNYSQAADDEEMREAGWTLVQAYLKLHKKGDAVKVLKELNERFGNEYSNESDNPYQQLLEILD